LQQVAVMRFERIISGSQTATTIARRRSSGLAVREGYSSTPSVFSFLKVTRGTNGGGTHKCLPPRPLERGCAPVMRSPYSSVGHPSAANVRRTRRPFSSIDLRSWQGRQIARRLPGSSVPPFALLKIWSTCVAGVALCLFLSHCWQRELSRARITRRSLSHAWP